jgi:hypothetical protein
MPSDACFSIFSASAGCQAGGVDGDRRLAHLGDGGHAQGGGVEGQRDDHRGSDHGSSLLVSSADCTVARVGNAARAVAALLRMFAVQ